MVHELDQKLAESGAVTAPRPQTPTTAGASAVDRGCGFRRSGEATFTVFGELQAVLIKTVWIKTP